MKVARVLLEGGEIHTVVLEGQETYTLGEVNPFDLSWPSERSTYRRLECKILKFVPPVLPKRVFLPAVNFRSHSSESSMEPPAKPYFFMKTKESVIGHEDRIPIPRGVSKVDYEGEIGVIIGKRGKYVRESEAMNYVLGFTVLNDVSIRDFQFPELHPYGLNWVMGKACDGCLPMGPWIVTRDEANFPMRITTKVNGEVRQEGTTEDMIFGVESMISYLSQAITLEPGDVISTGTPSGVAAFTGKRYLEEGDIVEVQVDKIGSLRNFIFREK